jgi:hypothetical protein
MGLYAEARIPHEYPDDFKRSKAKRKKGTDNPVKTSKTHPIE